MIAHFLNIGAALAAHEAVGIVFSHEIRMRCRLCRKETEASDIERDGACRTWCHTVHRYSLRDVHDGELPTLPWQIDHDPAVP